MWDGKYDEYGRRREVDIVGCAMPLQKIETIDEPLWRASAEGTMELFAKESRRLDDARNRLIWSDNKHADETGRRYRLSDITGPGGSGKGNPHYEFLGVTRYWRFSEKRMHELLQGRPDHSDQARNRSCAEAVSG